MIKAFGKMGLGVLLAMPLGAGPATAPATRPGYSQDAFDLGSADFAVRQRATLQLWWAGEAAEPILNAAVKSDNPEVAARAAELLRDIDDGIAPSTSQTVIRGLNLYRHGNPGRPDAKPRLILNLAARSDGVRVLLRLYVHEKDPSLRASIDAALAKSPRLPLTLLLGEGRRPEAEAILARSANLESGPAEEFVAYWQLRPDSPEKTAALKKASTEGPPWTRAMLEEAHGDYAAAWREIRKSSLGPLSNQLAARTADWKELEWALAPVGAEQLHNLTLAGLAARLAGDSAAADRCARQVASAEIEPNVDVRSAPWRRAVALCYAGRSADAPKLLIDAGDFVDAADLLEPQLKYAEELSLIDRAKSDPLQSVRLKARAVILLDELGKKDAAAQMLRDATGDNRMVKDYDAAKLLCRAARRLGRTDDADRLLLEMLTDWQESPASLEAAGFAQPVEALGWWSFLKQRQDAGSPLQAIHTLRALADGHVPAGELTQLTSEFETWSLSRPLPEQSAVLEAEASAWHWAGRSDRQMEVLKRRADGFPSVDSYMALGDCAEQREDWPAAADAYGNAAQYDPAFAPAVFLHGWALTKIGDAERGRQQMDLAHEISGTDENMQFEVFDAARQRGLNADADRERDVMLATGDYDNIGMIHLLGILSTDAINRKDYASAERYTDQTLWAIAAAGAAPLSRSMNIRMAAQLDLARAMALFGAHKFDAAMAEAKIASDADPNDSSATILLVRAADDSGAMPEGDALLDRSVARFAEILKHYSDSPELHNQIAWEESRCRRKLDDALAHAQRAANLAPQDAAILDTLAEAHYQRGEFQLAIDTETRCLSLSPSDPRVKQQLARFERGLKTKTAGGD